MTFKEAEARYKEHSEPYTRAYRNVASTKLSLEMAGSGQGIGSSDIYCKAIDLYITTDGNLGKLLDINIELERTCEELLSR
jgi:hypothetical protein